MDYNYEQIDKYIKGELSMLELQSFEQELVTNSALKEEVALYKDVDVSLNDHFRFEKDDKALKSTFNELGQKYAADYSANSKTISTNKNIGENYSKEETGKRTITRRLFPLAALAAAAALLLFLFNPFTNQISPVQLADQNFTPYELDAFMGSDTKTAWDDAIKYYRGKDYNMALEHINSFLQKNPNHTDALLAKGSSQLKLNQTDEAIQTFQQIKNSRTAAWYLGLAYLKSEDVSKAQPIFESLLNHKTYGAKAKDILNDL